MNSDRKMDLLKRKTFLPFAVPSIGDEEIADVVSCLRSGWLTTGIRARQFEEAFASYVGGSHAVAVNSCTAALHLALESVGVAQGDEVITTPMTFGATAAVIEHLKARPVFVDCDPLTFNINARAVEQSVTRKTKAVIPVHFAGQACDMDTISEIAGKNNFRVIEDAAHAVPTTYKGRMIGSIGDVTCFSFYATKNITTGEGGMAVTHNPDYAERMRLMSLHGMSRDAWKRYTQDGSWSYDILAPGYKYNMTDIAAAVGINQLAKCQSFYERRMRIAAMYHEAFSAIPEISPPFAGTHGQHAWHLFVILLNLEMLKIGRDEFIRELLASNIGVSVHFIPLHLHPYYALRYGYKPEDFPNAYQAFKRMISLPIYPRMTDADVHDVIEAVTRTVGRFKR